MQCDRALQFVHRLATSDKPVSAVSRDNLGTPVSGEFMTIFHDRCYDVLLRVSFSTHWHC